jgi:hypothetical protein
MLRADVIDTNSLILGNVTLGTAGVIKAHAQVVQFANTPAPVLSPYSVGFTGASRYANPTGDPAYVIRLTLPANLVHKWASVVITVTIGDPANYGFGHTKYIAATPCGFAGISGDTASELWIALATNAGEWVDPGALSTSIIFNVAIVDTP